MNPQLTGGTEILILPDGRILAHNITPEMAVFLSELDPDNENLKQRAAQAASAAPKTTTTHEPARRN